MKIFQIWISVFDSPKKFLVYNGGEFNNHEFISLCENVNIHICATAAEAPWSNGLLERHRLEQITFCQCTKFCVHEDVCSAQSCTQKSCTHVVVAH